MSTALLTNEFLALVFPSYLHFVDKSLDLHIEARRANTRFNFIVRNTKGGPLTSFTTPKTLTKPLHEYDVYAEMYAIFGKNLKDLTLPTTSVPQDILTEKLDRISAGIDVKKLLDNLIVEVEAELKKIDPAYRIIMQESSASSLRKLFIAKSFKWNYMLEVLLHPTAPKTLQLVLVPRHQLSFSAVQEADQLRQEVKNKLQQIGYSFI